MLYSTNTVFIESILLTSHLPLLIRPESLVLMTSLELFRHILLGPSPDLGTAQTKQWEVYNDLMSLINTETFPSFRKLAISVDGLHAGLGYLDSGQLVDYSPILPIRVVLLGPADTIAKQYNENLQEYVITFTHKIFELLRSTLDNVEVLESKGIPRDCCKQIWRPSKDIPGITHKGSIGYWIRTGSDDIMR